VAVLHCVDLVLQLFTIELITEQYFTVVDLLVLRSH
jgi:hypothetical protein